MVSATGIGERHRELNPVVWSCSRTSDQGVLAMSYRHLTREERNVIYRMRFQGYSDAEIARCLGCHRSTIGRECKRNASSDGR